ncbi:MAG TPA: Rrf2 family transcriptional regulator [Terriglobales bacterium]|nr:Rrf2 family transcriptional regulator [Terriglobales bacterium]
MFSRSTEYAIRAMAVLAKQPSGKLCGAREIAESAEIPRPFLWKILQNLTRKRLLRSFKGVRGGYELARPAQRISVLQVIDATTPADAMAGCMLGHGNCDSRHPCALHLVWANFSKDLTAKFRKTSLSDLARLSASRKRRNGHPA